MKKGNAAFVFCTVLLLWCGTAFGACIDNFDDIHRTTKQEVAAKQGKVTVSVNGDVLKEDYRCIVEPEIILEETKKGTIQDGSVIYFKTDENGKRFFSQKDYWIETEGLSATMKETEGESFDFALSIQRKNTNSLAKIKITFTPYISMEQWEKEENVTVIPLWLDVSTEKNNNLFAYAQNTKDILLNEYFLTALNEEEIIKNNLQSTEPVSEMIFTVDSNVAKWKEKTIQLKHSIFLTDTGKTMISFEDFQNIIEILKNDKKNIGTLYTQKQYSVLTEDIFTILLPQKQIQKGENQLYDLLEKEDGYYVPFRLFGDIFETNILWNGQQKTVTLWV